MSDCWPTLPIPYASCTRICPPSATVLSPPAAADVGAGVLKQDHVASPATGSTATWCSPRPTSSVVDVVVQSPALRSLLGL